MKLKVDIEEPWMAAESSTRYRVYASERPASAIAFPVTAQDVHLDRPPSSVPLCRPSRQNYASRDSNRKSQVLCCHFTVSFSRPTLAFHDRFSGANTTTGRAHSIDTHPQVVQSTPPPNSHPQQIYVTTVPDALPAVSEEEVQKCIRFFRTLTNLTNKDKKYAPGTREQVKQLVKEFTQHLQQLLDSKAQPQLLPFLRKTLPALREGLQSKRYTLELDDAPAEAPPQQPEPQPRIVYTSQPVAESQVIILPTYSTAQQSTYSTPQPNAYVEPHQLQMPDLPSTFLDAQALWSRLVEEVPDCESVDPDVITRISDVVEAKLRDLCNELADCAAHRLEPMRLNRHYQPLNDPRRQLRFVEELAKQEHERKSELEKEAAIKFSKSKSKDKDTLEKAKEIKRANQEENLNREANEAAIAALGGNRGTKRPWSYDPMKNAATSGLNVQSISIFIEIRNRKANILIEPEDFFESMDFNLGDLSKERCQRHFQSLVQQLKLKPIKQVDEFGLYDVVLPNNFTMDLRDNRWNSGIGVDALSG
ncbi:TAFH domain-containing protein [Aphelenchoides besseyi]|nr:TAFH domain-containing protein [Aphelenchoides besseyi]